MLNIAKGNTWWQVRRYQRSYDEILLSQVEKISKHILYKDKVDFPITEKFFRWANNVAKTSPNYLHVAEKIPFFSSLFKVCRGGLKTENIKIAVLGYAKEAADSMFRQFPPYDIEEKAGNLWLNEGIDEALLLIFGLGTPTPYNNANARLGVGNDGTAPSASQTGLLGTSTLFKALDSGFPDETISPQKVRVEATFGDSEAQFAWLEQSLDNGSSANKNLQRSNTNLGDKSTVTETWILRGDIGIS